MNIVAIVRINVTDVLLFVQDSSLNEVSFAATIGWGIMLAAISMICVDVSRLQQHICSRGCDPLKLTHPLSFGWLVVMTAWHEMGMRRAEAEVRRWSKRRRAWERKQACQAQSKQQRPASESRVDHGRLHLAQRGCMHTSPLPNTLDM